MNGKKTANCVACRVVKLESQKNIPTHCQVQDARENVIEDIVDRIGDGEATEFDVIILEHMRT